MVFLGLKQRLLQKRKLVEVRIMDEYRLEGLCGWVVCVLERILRYVGNIIEEPLRERMNFIILSVLMIDGLLWYILSIVLFIIQVQEIIPILKRMYMCCQSRFTLNELGEAECRLFFKCLQEPIKGTLQVLFETDDAHVICVAEFRSVDVILKEFEIMLLWQIVLPL